MSSVQRWAGPAGFPLSRAVRVGNLAFLSGQIPLDETGDPVRGPVDEQVRTVLVAIRDSLAEVGAALGDVVKTTVWLSDLSHYSDFNRVYAEFFPDGFPARSLVEAKLAFGVDVEIEVVAVVDQP